jgi:hypothetical protein
MIMKTRLILAALAGAVLYFFLGWLIYEILLGSYYEANTTHYAGLMKDMPNIYLLILSNLVSGFFMAFIFQRWAGFTTFMKGMTGGLILAFLMSLSLDLYFLSAMNLWNITVLIVDVVVSTVIGGIVGGVIGWILGMEKKIVNPEG